MKVALWAGFKPVLHHWLPLEIMLFLRLPELLSWWLNNTCVIIIGLLHKKQHVLYLQRSYWSTWCSSLQFTRKVTHRIQGYDTNSDSRSKNKTPNDVDNWDDKEYVPNSSQVWAMRYQGFKFPWQILLNCFSIMQNNACLQPSRICNTCWIYIQILIHYICIFNSKLTGIESDVLRYQTFQAILLVPTVVGARTCQLIRIPACQTSNVFLCGDPGDLGDSFF